MAVNETVILVLAGSAGVLLGVFFGSLLLRTSIILGGFYVVSGGHWDRLLACLLGFVIARFLVTRLTGPPVEHHNSRAKEAGHAP